MSVLKVIEILASSDKSWEDAVGNAVKSAAKSLRGIRSVYVQDQSAVVKDNIITEFGKLQIIFEVLNNYRFNLKRSWDNHF